MTRRGDSSSTGSRDAWFQHDLLQRRFPRGVSLVTFSGSKLVLHSIQTNSPPGSRDGEEIKMSLYQARFEQPAPWSTLLKFEPPLAVRTHLVADAMFVFALVILPMIAMIALLFLLGGAEPSAAVPDAMDGTGMLILAP